MTKADLHVHTTASDGVLTPAEVVELALSKGLSAVAITDHDTTAGVEQALEAAWGTPLEVIPGIELSAQLGPREVHILGYYIDHQDEALQENLGILGRARQERAMRMVRKLGKMRLLVSWERVMEIAGDTAALGRPHIAQALREGGYVDSIDEAFYKYIGLEGPAYVARYKLTPAQALQMIKAVRGVPVLAHPRGQEAVVADLVGLGLSGLEAYYPRYSVEESEALAKLASRHGLVATGGTDFHGYDGDAGFTLGTASVPMESVECLRALGYRQIAAGHQRGTALD